MSTSKLQDKTRDLLLTYLSGYEFSENFRPDWLQTSLGERLELDFYFDKLPFAVEVQGEQHYRYVKFFHKDKADYESGLRRDRIKEMICKERGIKLFRVDDVGEVIEAIEEIKVWIKSKAEEVIAHEKPEPLIPKSAVDSIVARAKNIQKGIINSEHPKILEQRITKLLNLCKRHNFPIEKLQEFGISEASLKFGVTPHVHKKTKTRHPQKLKSYKQNFEIELDLFK